MIFQNHSLLPWKSALANVVFATQARWPGWSRQQVREHAMKYIRLVGLEGSETRRPAELSGGMRQRVGIARAFAIEPKLLLMDEPFGALDALTRGTIQDELLRIWSDSGQTVFMITHDVDEAILLSDRILLMTNGPEAHVAEAVKVDIPGRGTGPPSSSTPTTTRPATTWSTSWSGAPGNCRGRAAPARRPRSMSARNRSPESGL